MGHSPTVAFTAGEIDSLRAEPFTLRASPICVNRFPAQLVLRLGAGFSMGIFLEAVPDSMLESIPNGWHWQPGSQETPIIVSRALLHLYNYGYAPANGLPRITEESLKTLYFDLVAGEDSIPAVFTARVVGFSDRVASFLVPLSFLDDANRKLANQPQGLPHKVVAEISDIADANFRRFLTSQSYVLDDATQQRAYYQQLIHAFAAVVAVLALVFMLGGTLGFSLLIERNILRVRASLSLLIQLGYPQAVLQGVLLGRFLPLLFLATLVAILITAGLQFIAAGHALFIPYHLSLSLGWPVYISAGFALCLQVLLVLRIVHKAISDG